MQNRVPSTLIVPDFTPVPRKYRYDGWTAERQRAFIAALAETGSVLAAAKRVNMASVGAYQLRLAPGSESFRAAWEAALAHGVQSLADIAIERAREGVPIPIFYKGEQCGERRWYNDRLITFILRHYLPGRFGAGALAAGTRNPETVAREAQENCPVCRARAEAGQSEQPATPEQEKQREAWFADILKRYKAKIRSERYYRLSGRVVAADFTLRQLTHIELILDCGGLGLDLIEHLTSGEDEHAYGRKALFASPLSQRLDTFRRAVWEQCGEPDRPAVHLWETLPSSYLGSGETRNERERAQAAAEHRIAEAQLEWEAAAREDSWAEWKARRRGEAGSSET